MGEITLCRPYKKKESKRFRRSIKILMAARFSDVIGLLEAKRCIREVLELPSLLPPGTLSGIRSLPTAILLHGPPGTGKTLLALAAATECGLPLHTITPSSILSMYLGEAEKALRRAFEEAAAGAPPSAAAAPPPPPR